VDVNSLESDSYAFGNFVLRPGKRLLISGGERVAVTPKVFDTLLYFVKNAGRVVEKDELMSALWPDTIVEENNLNKNISVLRRVLGEGLGDEQRYVATVPGRGYQFIADVEILAEKSQLAEATDRPAYSPPQLKDRRYVLSAALAGVVVLALGGWFFYRRGSDQPSTAQTLAILPFRSLVAENRDEALELGMTDTLIARFSGGDLVVRPLSSVRRFGAFDQDAVAAGRALDVDSVLEGNIQRWGDKLRVNVRLIRVSDSEILWSDTFDEKFTGLFTVQDSIAERVAAALSLRLNGAEQAKLKKRYTNNLKAYALYLRGRYHLFKITGADLRTSIEYFQGAIDEDPSYALAYAGMADSYRVLAVAAYAPSRDACPKAKALALRALELDETLVDAHVVLGWIGLFYDWNWKAAEAELKRAIELDPNNSEAHRAYGHVLSNSLRHDEAIREGRLARELAPLTLIVGTLEAQYLFFSGRHEDALDRAQKTRALDPNFWVARNVIGRILIGQGRYQEAISELQAAYKLSGGSADPLMQLGYAYGAAGDRANAEEQIKKLKELAHRQYVSDYNLAMIYNGLGERDEVVAHLERALDARETAMAFIKVDPRWDPIRNDARFTDIVARMNIVE